MKSPFHRLQAVTAARMALPLQGQWQPVLHLQGGAEKGPDAEAPMKDPNKQIDRNFDE